MTPVESAGAMRGGGADMVIGEHESLDRLANAVVTVVPLALLGLAAWLAWGGTLVWQDLVVLAITYLLTGLGVTVGYHRLFTHRSFKTSPAMRIVLGALGSAAIEGPVIEWVSTHRQHHRYSDHPGDPHSPHTEHAGGWGGALRGLYHAHVGWTFGGAGSGRASSEHYAKDLLADPAVRFVDRAFLLWVALGMALPFGLGVALTGSIVGGLTGLLWGGAVRVLFLHHATFSINSLCHFFGRRGYRTGDESRNLAWLGPADVGGGLAQQPSRLPHLRPSWSALVAARSVGVADRGAGARGLDLGRRAHRARAPADEGALKPF